MAKPQTFDGYDKRFTLDCERVLVTLMRGLGPWKDSVYLIGGLTPRYLVDSSVDGVPPHAGTQDVDIVIYCLEHAAGGVAAAKEQFRKELAGKHAETVCSALEILRKRFASDETVEGYKKDGPVAVAKFELGESNEAAIREARILRQRDVSHVIEELVRVLK